MGLARLDTYKRYALQRRSASHSFLLLRDAWLICALVQYTRIYHDACSRLRARSHGRPCIMVRHFQAPVYFSSLIRAWARGPFCALARGSHLSLSLFQGTGPPHATPKLSYFPKNLQTKTPKLSHCTRCRGQKGGTKN